MTNKTKKIVGTILATVTALSTLASCKPPVHKWESDDLDADTLMVSVYDGGYGTNWIKVAAENFNAENPNSKYKIRIKAEKTDISTVRSYSEQGININRGECAYYVGGNADEIKRGVREGVFADLSDLLTREPDGDGRTIQEKIRNFDVWSTAFSDENGSGLYALPYSDSVVGFIFNYDKFLEDGFLTTVSPSDSAALAELTAQGVTYEIMNL